MSSCLTKGQVRGMLAPVFVDFEKESKKIRNKVRKICGGDKKLASVLLLTNSYLVAVGRIGEEEDYSLWDEDDIDEFVSELKKCLS